MTRAGKQQPVVVKGAKCDIVAGDDAWRTINGKTAIMRPRRK